MDPLLSVEETASYLGVKRQTLASWRCLGRYPLRFVKCGRHVRYRQSDVEKFLADRSAMHTGELTGASAGAR